tara:strand:- start:12096 stop:13463 length:1368 start_codon:yes stop_codon:yes gene_type:complete
VNSSERYAVGNVSLLYAMRMLGLFMVLPVFTLYSGELAGATPVLIGVAIGIYGLSQALLQIPFGALSDRFGRKPLMLTGLGLFVMGSLLAAFSESIYLMIAGRFLQGAGAIASVLMAYLADATREDNRSKAMATVGMTIGLSFGVALIAGPILASLGGLYLIFLITAVLGALGMLLVMRMPTIIIQRHRTSRDVAFIKDDLRKVLKDPALLRLDVSVLLLHLSLTMLFVSLPMVLKNQWALPVEDHGWVYLGLMAIGFALMVPGLIYAEKQRQLPLVFRVAVLTLIVGMLVLGLFQASVLISCIALALFFAGFNFMEASLPSMLSRLAPAGQRGTAMGVFASCQFGGAFLGGVLGGVLLNTGRPELAFYAISALACVWFLFTLGMKNPPATQTSVISLRRFTEDQIDGLQESLLAVNGVTDVTLIMEDQLAYLKIDKSRLDRRALDQFTLGSHEA